MGARRAGTPMLVHPLTRSIPVVSVGTALASLFRLHLPLALGENRAALLERVAGPLPK